MLWSPTWGVRDQEFASWQTLTDPAAAPWSFQTTSAANGVGLRRDAATRFCYNAGSVLATDPSFGYTHEAYYLDAPNTQTEFYHYFKRVGGAAELRPFSWNAKHGSDYVDIGFQSNLISFQTLFAAVEYMQITPTTVQLNAVSLKQATNNAAWLYQIRTDGTTYGELMRLNAADQLEIAPGFGFRVILPDSILDVRQTDVATGESDILCLTNKSNAVAMTNTRTAILWSQWYYDAVTPATADAAKIEIATEGNWTSVAGTRDASMAFWLAVDGVLTQSLKLSPTGTFKCQIGNGTVGSVLTHTVMVTDPAMAKFGCYVNNVGVSFQSSGTYGAIYAYDYAAAAVDLMLQQYGGRVAIGNTAPGYTLDVTGNGRFTTGLGLWNHAPPGAQPAAPAGTDAQKIADITAILQGMGACA